MRAVNAIPDILRALDTESSLLFKEQALIALGRLGQKNVVLRLLEEFQRVIKQFESKGMDFLDYKAKPSLIPVAFALSLLGEESGTNMLIDALSYGITGTFRGIVPNHSQANILKEIRQAACLALGEVSDKRVVHPLLNCLLGHSQEERVRPNPNIGCGGRCQGDTPVVTIPADQWECFKVLGDYRHLILEAAMFTKTGKDHFGGIDFTYSIEAALKATSRLCQVTTGISTNILHHILKRHDFSLMSVWGGENAGDSYMQLSFEEQRKLAEAELTNRGNPSYDQALFLVEEEWRL